jgi:hypothetical protein
VRVRHVKKPHPPPSESRFFYIFDGARALFFPAAMRVKVFEAWSAFCGE